MKILFQFVVSCSFLFSVFLPIFADAAVYVNGYYRKDGTYVSPHYRSNPDGNPYNNWSFPGNTNPYTGVTAGGNTDTYLNNYYGGSGVSSPSYGGGSNTSSFEVVDGGYKSYGVLTCNYNYYKIGDTCKSAPLNGRALHDTFLCNTGYQKYGDSCVFVPSNASYNGSIWFCNDGYYKLGDSCAIAPLNSITSGTIWTCRYGYTQYNDTCIPTIENAQLVSGKWECNDNYYVDASGLKCAHIDQICKSNFGQSSYGTGKSCSCISGYEFKTDNSGSKSCVEIVTKPEKTSLVGGVVGEERNNKKEKYQFTRDLGVDFDGDDVVQLQEFLESEGFLIMPSGAVKGYFGRRTADALKRYQKNKNLPATGYFGPLTRASVELF